MFNPRYNGSRGAPWEDQSDKLSQTGVYASDRIKFGKWVLTLGGRYDWVNNGSTDNLANEVTTSKDAAFTGRAGLGYLFDNGVAPYASYSTSFQPSAGTDFSGEMFKPTTGEQWEAGIKYQPLGWNALFTASVFDIIQQNVTTSDSINIGFLVQQGEVRSRGFEFEAKADLTNSLSVIAGYSYTDARITKDNPNAFGVSQVGHRLQSVPYHQAALWLDYQFMNPELRGLKVGGCVRYLGDSMAPKDAATGTQVDVPGYTLLDARISYDFGAQYADLKGFSLAVSGTNLTDEKYFTPGFTSNSVLFGNRRSIIATLAYKW